MGLLHVYTDRAEEGYDAETAQKARRGRDGELAGRDLLFWQAVGARGGLDYPECTIGRDRGHVRGCVEGESEGGSEEDEGEVGQEGNGDGGLERGRGLGQRLARAVSGGSKRERRSMPV